MIFDEVSRDASSLSPASGGSAEHSEAQGEVSGDLPLHHAR
jgi:hypothetical protein